MLTVRRVADRRDHAALLRQHRGLADRDQRHHGAADDLRRRPRPTTAWSCRSTAPISPSRRTACRPRRSSSPTCARWSACSQALRSAPVVDPYTGPAILSGRAAGVFFHEIFGHRIEGHRTKQADDAQTFAKRLNQPVLPAFLSVVFDPTLERDGDHRAGRPLRLRRRRREGAAGGRRRSRHPEDVPHEPLAGRRHRPVERARPRDARPGAGLAPVEPGRRRQRDGARSTSWWRG